jgi:hypothetical protein
VYKSVEIIEKYFVAKIFEKVIELKKIIVGDLIKLKLFGIP